ncbi:MULTISPECIES: FMN-binding protein MioC [Alteromonadaceae]|uniref:FMN-binding protein MioC n=1 Tax=Alteromonadaceae TaxID=72275 RepID=UPI001C09D421|nr:MULTISPECIES: FMN-binding protein MioC [Aliiglaciecola]MBU2876503.1 FMN-binding protein MioC [Aliiglaciecola lipolytica]MDO6713035.1 FMN-binding protein MioC [Aliiglaciecola sp. 2_MG-2023]MDO6754074.1 FMN-binding protein MioC [Aliiglaciecola sp. 1_MG-2023]
MANYEIIVGTMLGASEYVADALQETLEANGHSANIHLEPNIEEIPNEGKWLICTSTHGAGELPDNIQAFAKQIKNHSLDNVQFLVVGLGDSSYDTYCYGAKTMQELLHNSGATLLSPAFHIDVLNHPIPEEAAVEWLTSYLQQN